MKLTSRAWGILQSLQVRVALFLSLAILPLGIIAVVQNASVIRDARVLEQGEMLSRTAEAASSESDLLRRAQGAATALGLSAFSVGETSQACDQVMSNFVAAHPSYIFAGFTSRDGILRCSSSAQDVDVRERDVWRDFIENPREMIVSQSVGAATGQSVLIAIVPVYDPQTADLLGAASVSLPHSLTDTLFSVQMDNIDLALISPDGGILTSSVGMAGRGVIRDIGLVPSELPIEQGGSIFDIVDMSGERRLAAVVPLIDNKVFILGLWKAADQEYDGSILGRFTSVFPILMWFVALGVALLALDRLALRHLRELRDRMAGFSVDEPTDGFVNLDTPPAEFLDIATTYNSMVDRMLADRAELAQNLEEKEVLLREVHHRVKNNLQLIASILNMQIRSVADGDAKRVLRRVQDRVMSLSSIHKALYTGSNMSAVRADVLLEDVIQSAIKVGVPPGKGVETSVSLAPLVLDPDQAVPLALMVNELVTNAIKYVGRPSDGPPAIAVRLETDERRCVTVEVVNSVGTAVQDAFAEGGSGLGTRLTEAFVAQLGGTASVVHDDGLYTFTMEFEAFEPTAPMIPANPSPVAVAQAS